MTFVQAAFFVPCLVCAISVWWLLAYAPRDMTQDRMTDAGGLENLEDLRWTGWSVKKGWDPATCWHGCEDLHRDDWWRLYMSQTCWHGCVHLHRDDWWRAYLDQAEEASEQTAQALSLDPRPHRRRVGLRQRGAVQQS
jgi:hypothetical protein